MSNEEIRKLIGGYATNTLTGSERKALFEAALTDQGLFDALQDEQALKHLLADPESRQQIREALEPRVNERHSSWWSRRWAWGGAIGAVAATVLIVAVVHRQQPPATSGPVEIASTQQPAKPLPDQQPSKDIKTAREAEPPDQPIKVAPKRVRQEAANTAAPAPSEQVTAEAAPNAISGGALGGVAGSAPAGVAGFRPLLKESPLRYSLLRSDAQGLYNSIASEAELRPGDMVRVNVSTATSGYLSLEQLMPSGEWKRVFPESPQGRLVAANTDYTIPDSGIVVENSAQKFRISLLAQEPPKQLATDARQKTLARAQVAADITGAAPLTIEITIGPGQAP